MSRTHPVKRRPLVTLAAGGAVAIRPFVNMAVEAELAHFVQAGSTACVSSRLAPRPREFESTGANVHRALAAGQWPGKGNAMRILIAYDGSIQAGTAIDDLQWAGLPRQAEVLLLSAVDCLSPEPELVGVGAARSARPPRVSWRKGDAVADTARGRLNNYFPDWDVRLERFSGEPANFILDKASAWSADLIVVGMHGRTGLARAVLGSVSLKMAQGAACSVRVARPRPHRGALRLLVANDGSLEAQATVYAVARRFWPPGTEARVVAAHEPLLPSAAEPNGSVSIDTRLYHQINEDEQFRLRHVVNEAAEKLRCAGLNAAAMVGQGPPNEVLLGEARSWNADTIFVGARGLTCLDRVLLGSVSSVCVTHAPCSVEIVHSR